jgi:hypothetical protein
MVTNSAATKQLMYMPVWESRHINVECKTVAMWTCVRPTVEYGAEVWAPNPQGKWAATDTIVQIHIINQVCVRAMSGLAHMLCWLTGV